MTFEKAAVSGRAARIAFSPTLRVSGLAKRMRAEGQDVIDFGVGQPDFPTPEIVKEAGKRAITYNRTGYTPTEGIPELREAVCAKLKRENSLRYAPEDVLVSPGAKASLFFLALALLDADDEAILPAPYWVSYPEQIRMAEARPVVVHTLEEDGFKLRPDDLEAAITSRTKAVILNYPSNPTGCCYDRDELQELGSVCLRHGLWVIADEIYEKLVYDGLCFTSIASLDEEIKSRTITVNGVSKSFSMTGWRLGYAAGPREVIQAMGRLQSHSTSNATSISQWAALEALRSAEDEVKAMVAEFGARRDIMLRSLKALPGVSCPAPQGAFYAFPNFSAYEGRRGSGGTIENDEDLAMYLLHSARVAAVPGAAFGAPFHLRFSYATSREQIEEGMTRVHEALSAL